MIENFSEIYNELDHLNEKQNFNRSDYIWCNKTIKRLLYELHKLKEINTTKLQEELKCQKL